MGMAASVAEARECLRTGEGLEVTEDGCYIWPEPAPNGYGPFISFWVAEHGQQPEQGLEVDWTCHNGPNGCVNPMHMELVTPEEKQRRAGRPLDGRDKQAWAKALTAEREVRGWSQKRMADELHVSSSTIKNWESGRYAPSRSMARMVGYKLGWQLEPTRWVVTFVVQDVVVATTAGEAAAKAGATLNLDPPRKKGQVYSVRAVR